MIEIGTRQRLQVIRCKEFGVYLAEDAAQEGVLLPKKQVPEGMDRIGAQLDVFVYRDSQDRLIATTQTPKLQLGEIGVLTVKDTNRIGAFLDWGLEKDLLLPFHEQSRPLKKGDHCLVAVYLDKSSRLCATTKIYPYLSPDSPYHEKDTVTGIVYAIRDKNLFVAVDAKYYGMIPAKDIYDTYRIGQTVEAAVVRVRPDGKLDLGLRKKAYKQIDTDAERVLAVIDSFGGVLPFGENAAPEVIQREFHMSKSAFKRAVGRLYKEGIVEIRETCVRRAQQ